MLVHPRVTPSSKYAGSYLYTWVKRGTVRVKSLSQEHNVMSRTGLEPEPFDQESSALTIRPPRLPRIMFWRASKRVPKMSQNIARGWLNLKILCPTMLKYVVLKCCDPLRLGLWMEGLMGGRWCLAVKNKLFWQGLGVERGIPDPTFPLYSCESRFPHFLKSFSWIQLSFQGKDFFLVCLPLLHSFNL